MSGSERLKQPRAIIFDIGGVLVRDHWACVSAKLSSLTKVPQVKLLAELKTLSPKLDVGELDLASMCSRLEILVRARLDYSTFSRIALDECLIEIPSTRATIERLRKDGTLRVIALSNMGREVWQAMNAKFGYSSLFRDVVLSCETGVLKPDPRSFQIACERADSPPPLCIFVDDSEVNIRAAARFGLRAVLVHTGAIGLDRDLRALGLIHLTQNGDGFRDFSATSG